MMSGISHNTKLTVQQTRELIEVARGRRECDLVIRGGYVANVFTGEILLADVGTMHGRIAVVATNGGLEGKREIDAEGLFLAPGLIDGHMHLESSMLTPAEFTRAALPLGTTAVVMDPHEIANVAGPEGLRELMEASAGLPISFYAVVSPAVPESNLVTSGGEITASDIASFADNPRVLGIAEAMNFPGVIEAREDVLERLAAMPGKVIDGHAPGLSGRDLQAYVAAGIDSEHEATNSWEGMEKLRAGMYLMIREGSAARDLDDLIGLVDPHTVDRCLLVTDDLSPADLERDGHMDNLLRKVVRHGVSPVQAVRMATINTAQRFRLAGVGAIAPGYAADIAAFEDLSDFRAAFVVASGEIAAMDGEVTIPLREHSFTERLTHTVRLPRLTAGSLAIPAGPGQVRVIQAMDGELITRQLVVTPPVIGDHVAPDIERDILKIAVVERHGKNGNVAVGLVSGFELKKGAMAGSVAHDSHNVVAVGTGDQDILRAIERVGEMQGGLVVVDNGKVVAELPLPLAGLMSTPRAGAVAGQFARLEDAARSLGCRMQHPFMTLSFMCLSVIPELKITDRGLVDVAGPEIVPLFTGEESTARRTAAG